MGTCCSSNSFKKEENKPTIKKDRWYADNVNFDIHAYKKSILMEDYLSFQEILRKNWSEIDYFEYSFERLRPLIMRGIPNSMMKTVLLHIFPVDGGVSEEEYLSQFKAIEKPADLQSKNYLYMTENGVSAANRIMKAIGSDDKEFLLRVIQIMLWYLKEHEVYGIARALFKGTCFPVQATLIDSAFRYLQDYLRKQLNPKIKDLLRHMVSNLLIGYAQPILYSNLLCYFLADGVVSLLKCSVAMVIQSYNKIAAVLDDETDWETTLKDIRQVVYANTELTALLLNMNFVNFKVFHPTLK